jgi:hypothetical protein
MNVVNPWPSTLGVGAKCEIVVENKLFLIYFPVKKPIFSHEYASLHNFRKGTKRNDLSRKYRLLMPAFQAGGTFSKINRTIRFFRRKQLRITQNEQALSGDQDDGCRLWMSEPGWNLRVVLNSTPCSDLRFRLHTTSFIKHYRCSTQQSIDAFITRPTFLGLPRKRSNMRPTASYWSQEFHWKFQNKPASPRKFATLHFFLQAFLASASQCFPKRSISCSEKTSPKSISARPPGYAITPTLHSAVWPNFVGCPQEVTFLQAPRLLLHLRSVGFDPLTGLQVRPFSWPNTKTSKICV